MGNRLDEVTSTIRIGLGRLIGNRQLHLNGVAGLARARARRKTKTAVRPDIGRFRDTVGQMTGNERLAAQVESAGQQDQADRNG